MTKHLRLIMLSLLAMICLGGYSQSETVYTTLSFPDANHANNNVGGYDKTWVAKIGNDTWSIENCNNNNWNNWDYIAMGWKNKATIASIATETDLRAAITKVVVYYKTAEKLEYLNTFKLIVASDKDFNNIVETIDGDKSFSATTPSTFTITNPKEERYFKLVYDLKETGGKKNGQNGIIKISSIAYYAKSATSKTPTTTTFGADYDGKTFNFVDGVLEGWKAPTATHTPADVAGTITYTSDKETVATVDQNVQLTFTGYGTATITATFTPEDEKTYAGSTASYTITNIKSKYYATVADLRKDLNNGTLNANDEVAVKLTEAKVLYVNQWTSNKVDHTQYFVREGNAAISFYDTDIKMSKSAVVNGTFMGKIGSLTGLLVLTKNNNTNPADLQVKASTKPAEPIEISTDDIANYVCDLVTVKGATVIGGTECALSNGNNLKPLYYNKFYPKTTSLGAPYANANVDLTSAIVLTYVNKQNELVYELAPTDKYSLVYNLSEESVNAIAAKTDVAVSLKRTFYKDGGWNTLCLPFAVNATDFEGAEVREVDVTQSSENTIVFKKATTIEAGKPYLIKWAKTPNEVCDFVNTFEGVTLVATATPVKVNDAITFTGFYNKATADKLGASVAAIGAENKLFKVTSGEMKGFRAAFVLNPASPAAGIMVVIDGTTTGIEDLVVDGVKANGRVYNLNGQYVGNSLNGLQPGIYIQNGKKVVVK